MTEPRKPKGPMQNIRDHEFIAAKLRTRIGRRRQLGYSDVPVSLLDLEYLIEIATPVATVPCKLASLLQAVAA